MWLRGLFASLSLIGIGVVSYTIYESYGVSPMGASIACTFISLVLITTLIYAYEEDDFMAGAMIPFIALIGFAIGYLLQPPAEETLFSCFLGAILALILIQEGV